jgi:hypothetical protein
MNPGPVETAGEVASGAVTAMQSTPLAIALLIVNICFLGFAGYVLSEVAASSRARNTEQQALISSLIKDCQLKGTHL